MKYSANDFLDDVLRIARQQGHRIETLRGSDIPQIDFGIKKLHARHICALFPAVLADDADINRLIKDIAPGRPCAHKPFREIVSQIHRERPNAYTEAS
jgi:hypothetical protein